LRGPEFERRAGASKSPIGGKMKRKIGTAKHQKNERHPEQLASPLALKESWCNDTQKKRGKEGARNFAQGVRVEKRERGGRRRKPMEVLSGNNELSGEKKIWRRKNGKGKRGRGGEFTALEERKETANTLKGY